MDKPQVNTRSVYFLFIIFSALIPLSKCNHMVRVVEGEIMTLVFPYPCDSDKITIQRANGAPFYNSAEPGYLNLPDFDSHRFSVKDKNCSVQVEINPVMRGDRAAYICKAYRDGNILADFIRVRLNVDYSPGRVSCVPSDRHTVGHWVPLKCEMSAGILTREIICYQDAKRLLPDIGLQQTGKIWKETIWATKEHPVFCCSSIVDQPTDICECNDFAWDPSYTESVLHPCPSTTPLLLTTLTDHLGENSTDHPFPNTMELHNTVTLLTSIITQNKVHVSQWLWGGVMTIIALLACVVVGLALILLCIWCKGKLNNTYSTEKKDECTGTSELRSKMKDECTETSELRSKMEDECTETSELRSKMKDKCTGTGEMRSKMGDGSSKIPDEGFVSLEQYMHAQQS